MSDTEKDKGPHYITDTSSEFKEHQALVKDNYARRHEPFGANILGTVEDLQNGSGEVLELIYGTSDRDEALARTIDGARAKLQDLYESPARKALFEAINHSFEPGFFGKLDKYISDHGTLETAQIMEEDWRGILKG